MPSAAQLPTRVVLYHGIAPARDRHEISAAKLPEMGKFTPLDVFEAHVARLIDMGYRFVTAGELSELWTGTMPPPGLAVLTFDDGLRDGLTRAAVSLKRFGVRATFYLCPGAFGGHIARFGAAGAILTRDEARELYATGMELGSHTVSHHNVLELDDDDLRRELVDSRTVIEELTGEPCRTLAYPTGRHDPRVECAAADAGYRLAFACRSGPWRRFAAPRWQAPVLDLAEVVHRRFELGLAPV